MRNAEADLKIAEAIPGPLNYDERVGCVAVYPGEKWNCLSDFEKIAVYYAGGYKVNDEKGNFKNWEIAPEKLAVAKFIALAREALPYWIKRCQALEMAAAAAINRSVTLADRMGAVVPVELLGALEIAMEGKEV